MAGSGGVPQIQSPLPGQARPELAEGKGAGDDREGSSSACQPSLVHQYANLGYCEPKFAQPECVAVTPALCRTCWLGRDVDYREAWKLQCRLAEQRAKGAIPDTLLLLEHAHVYTAGRLSPPEHLLLDTEGLRTLGVPLVETDRGGLVTYHGPGQLMGYPVLSLAEWGTGPRRYVRFLEQVLVETLADFGICAHTEEGLPGVWVYGAKIAAIGVRISRGVTLHGLALNVDPDLDYYQHIVPCGVPDGDVTSMARLLRHAVPMDAVRRALMRHFAHWAGATLEPFPASALQDVAT